MSRVLLAVLTLFAIAAPAAQAAPPRLFPSDELTVADTGQLTGRRVNLPRPDCAARPSDCDEIRLLNQLDGFDVEPRVEIAFGEPIDLAKVTGDSVYIVKAGGTERIALNRLVWSPARNTLYGQPVQLLEEGTTYELHVTEAVSGEGAATRFTTMSIADGMLDMRRQLDDGSAYDAAGIAGADRGLDVTIDGARRVYPAAAVARIRQLGDRGKNGIVAADVIDTAKQNAATYAFGSYRSPSWLTAERIIPQLPTKSGKPAVTGLERIGFTLILPAGEKPAKGWPVMIHTPGITRSKYDAFLAADNNARLGFATMAIDPVGHSYGPKTKTEVTTPAGVETFDAFGRAVDVDGDGVLTDREGVQAKGQPSPVASIGLRDGLRQTTLDNMALIRAIRRGADIDGDGSPDLDGERVTQYGLSLGSIYGTILIATEQHLSVSALNVPGGPITEIARLGGFRRDLGKELGRRKPSLLNGGRDGFTESTPLYVDPPVTAPARGAVAIQEVGSRSNWLNRPGSPEAFAPYIEKRPLPGQPDKRVFYQLAFGDRTVPNPTSAQLVRAAGLEKTTYVYRNDRTPTASANPHGFLIDPRITGRGMAQEQVSEFLASGGSSLIDPDGGGPIFEQDFAVLERLNYERPRATGEPPAETAADAPPAGRKARLRVTVTPKRVRKGTRTRYRIRVTSGGRPVRGARIAFAGRKRTTGRRGRATVRVALRRSARVRATKRGFRSGTTRVRVRA